MHPFKIATNDNWLHDWKQTNTKTYSLKTRCDCWMAFSNLQHKKKTHQEFDKMFRCNCKGSPVSGLVAADQKDRHTCSASEEPGRFEEVGWIKEVRGDALCWSNAHLYAKQAELRAKSAA